MEKYVNDDKFLELVEFLEHLPEYRKKQIAALLIHSTLTPMSSNLVSDRAIMWAAIDLAGD